MGFGDKMKFWKKEEEDFSDLGDFGLGDLGSSPKGPSGTPAEKDPFNSGLGDPMLDSQPMNPTAPPGMSSPDMNMGGTPASPGMSSPDMSMGQDPNIGMQQQPQQDMNQPTFPTASNRMMPQQPQAQPEPMQPPAYPPPTQPQNYGQPTYSKDIEIISAKLDSLRATLESINQRLANLERAAQLNAKNKYEW